jgi:DNA (cytosine-5)-methyltransferase 1
MKKEKEPLRVIELFAGVGGFRIGLEGYNGLSATSNYTKPLERTFKVIWSNQWEPATKKQHASQVYEHRFGSENHICTDIAKVDTASIPDHDVLCGGFPCQDYSVAKQLSKSSGIQGKKGVLWWEIHRILDIKKPKYLFLENVDRLLKSPTTSRGRDFAIMLASLSDLGYSVEWRVIDASTYGFPQRRKRVFMVGVLNEKIEDPIDRIESGILGSAFPIDEINPLSLISTQLEGDLVELTNNFKTSKNVSPFLEGGVMYNRTAYSCSVSPDFNGQSTLLKDVLLPLRDVPQDFFVSPDDEPKWEYLKGGKKEERKKSDGTIFYYNEGPIAYPDYLDRPARTIITSEGGKTPSRFKLIIRQEGRLRRLTPLELERLNMFPDNHTSTESDVKRAFFMGNALVVGAVELIGQSLIKFNDK